MIAASAKTMTALLGDPVTLLERIKWHFGGDTEAVDVTDRLIDRGPVRRSLTPYIGSTLTGTVGLVLDNSDGRLAPQKRPGLLQESFESYWRNKITFEEGVVAGDGSVEYLPVFTGFVTRPRYSGGTLELTIEDILGEVMKEPLKEQYSIPMNTGLDDSGNATRETPVGDVVKGLLDLSRVGSTAYDTSDTTTTNSSNGLMEAGWILQGEVPQATQLGVALGHVARSSLCHLLTTEDGKVRLSCELPEFAKSDYPIIRERIGAVFDETNAYGWSMTPLEELVATQFIVQYQGTTAREKNTTLDTAIGTGTRTAAMPYCARGHQASYAARVLLRMSESPPLHVSFRSHGIGRLVQLGDWFRATDPYTEVERLYRAVGKSHRRAGVVLEGVHESTWMDEIDDDYAIYNETSYGVENLY